jgi:ferredoxin
MRIVVDFDACSSNAMCMGVAPELFAVRDDGFLYVLNDHPEGDLVVKARSAASVCPNQAITLLED